VLTSLGSIVHEILRNLTEKVPYKEMFAEWDVCYTYKPKAKISDSLTTMLLREFSVLPISYLAQRVE
jgi:hypothetical protein